MSIVGQFGVVRTNGIVAWGIRLGTRSQVNHAFLVLDDNGTIIEAEPQGARLSHLSHYPDAVMSHLELTPEQQQHVVAAGRALRDTPYNWLDIVGLGLLSLGLRWRWLQTRAQSSKTLICSQLVDRVYDLAGIHLYDDGRPDGEVTPGDLLTLLAERSERTVL
jgi:hypothetical protein